MKNLGFVAVLALVLGAASAFTTSSRTAMLDNCRTQSGNIDNECPYDPDTDCCILLKGNFATQTIDGTPTPVGSSSANFTVKGIHQ